MVIAIKASPGRPRCVDEPLEDVVEAVIVSARSQVRRIGRECKSGNAGTVHMDARMRLVNSAAICWQSPRAAAISVEHDFSALRNALSQLRRSIGDECDGT